MEKILLCTVIKNTHCQNDPHSNISVKTIKTHARPVAANTMRLRTYTFFYRRTITMTKASSNFVWMDDVTMDYKASTFCKLCWSGFNKLRPNPHIQGSFKKISESIRTHKNLVKPNLHPGRSFHKSAVTVTWYCVCMWTNGQTASKKLRKSFENT